MPWVTVDLYKYKLIFKYVKLTYTLYITSNKHKGRVMLPIFMNYEKKNVTMSL